MEIKARESTLLEGREHMTTFVVILLSLRCLKIMGKVMRCFSISRNIDSRVYLAGFFYSGLYVFISFYLLPRYRKFVYVNDVHDLIFATDELTSGKRREGILEPFTGGW
jgi:hypothetical protein